MPSTIQIPWYGPRQLADYLGLQVFQFDRARAQKLIPDPDNRPGTKWSAAVAVELAARVDQIRQAVGNVPDVGAHRAALYLSGKLGVEVGSDTVHELARMGKLTRAGSYKGAPLYSGRSVQAFNDPVALAKAAVDGRLLTTNEVAEELAVRRSDVDHLIRAGLLESAFASRSMWSARNDLDVQLFRHADVRAVVERDDIDWPAVRAVQPGQRSPLAKLPDAVPATGA